MVHGKKPLDARLRAAADLMLEVLRDREKPVAADIGCDHGFVTAYLLRQRPELFMIAGDISAPSLRKTEVLLQQAALDDRARTVCGDGLSVLAGQRMDAILIAGMGGIAILDILKNGAEEIGETPLVLQANTDLPLLRQGLSEMGIGIERELYPEAGGRLYTVLLARRGAQVLQDERAFQLGLAAGGIQNQGQRMYIERMRGQITENMMRIARGARQKTKLESLGQMLGWIEEAMGMKELNAAELTALVGEIAPYELAEEWDNVGLLQGYRDRKIERALVALDLTQQVFEEAVALGCQAVITHHPFMFRPIKRLTDETREGRLMLQMAEKGMVHIAAHTNLDAAPGGVNDTLMQKMGATNVRGEGCLRVGDIGLMTFGELCERARKNLGQQVRTYGEEDTPVRCLGCCSGAGSDEYLEAMALGADCFITGEVRHNVGLDAMDQGCPMIEAGHYETEAPVCPWLTETLQKKADQLQYKVTFFCSGINLLGHKA